MILCFSGAKLHNTELILLPKEETEAIGLISTSRMQIGILEDLNWLHEATRANPPPGGADRPSPAPSRLLLQATYIASKDASKPDAKVGLNQGLRFHALGYINSPLGSPLKESVEELDHLFLICEDKARS
jgi:hypothetical protein